LHYIRIEQVETMVRMKGWYRRKIGSAKIHEHETETWLDGYQVLADEGRVRSADILISRDGSSPSASSGFSAGDGYSGNSNGNPRRRGATSPDREPESLVVEILVVEAERPPKNEEPGKSPDS